MENNWKKTLGSICRGKLKVTKEEEVLVHLPFIFCLCIGLCAPVVVLLGVLIAQGECKFMLEKYAEPEE